MHLVCQGTRWDDHRWLQAFLDICFNHQNRDDEPYEEHIFEMGWNHQSDPVTDQSQVWATNLKEEVSHSQCLADSDPGWYSSWQNLREMLGVPQLGLPETGQFKGRLMINHDILG